jgi:vacuolar protein sorting-associated protein 16
MIFDESEVLLMSGPYGDSIQYKNGEPTKQLAECDGVRILSNSSMIVIH